MHSETQRPRVLHTAPLLSNCYNTPASPWAELLLKGYELPVLTGRPRIIYVLQIWTAEKYV